MAEDMVKKPEHYMFEINGQETQALDIVKGLLTEEEFRGFIKGSYYTYLMRADRKNGLEDLQKAKTYLDWQIELDQGLDLNIPGKENNLKDKISCNDTMCSIVEADIKDTVKDSKGDVINLILKVTKPNWDVKPLRKYRLNNSNFKDCFKFLQNNIEDFNFSKLKLVLPIFKAIGDSRTLASSLLPEYVVDDTNIIVKIYEDQLKVNLTNEESGIISDMKLCIDLVFDHNVYTFYITNSSLKGTNINKITWEDPFTGEEIPNDTYCHTLTDEFANFIVNVVKENITFEDDKKIDKIN